MRDCVDTLDAPSIHSSLCETKINSSFVRLETHGSGKNAGDTNAGSARRTRAAPPRSRCVSVRHPGRCARVLAVRCDAKNRAKNGEKERDVTRNAPSAAAVRAVVAATRTGFAFLGLALAIGVAGPGFGALGSHDFAFELAGRSWGAGLALSTAGIAAWCGKERDGGGQRREGG